MMNKAGLIIAGGAVGFGVWYYMQQQQQNNAPADFSWLDNLPGAVNAAVDTVTGGFMRVSAMKNVTAADVQNENVQAFLRVIRKGEGTSGSNGYNLIFGGQTFSSYADHPRITVNKSGYKSSAAGAYQFIISTWDETKRIMGLTDFSPATQDLAAVGRIMARGALDDVKAGRFEIALKKVAKEWASLPGSPYGQPTISLATAKAVYLAYSGDIASGGVLV
jgi:muramidase (phage lysozyme)